MKRRIRQECEVTEFISVGHCTMYGMTMFVANCRAKTPNGNILPMQVFFLTIDEAAALDVGDKFVYSF